MRPLVIIGAGGHGREALDIALAMNAVRPTFDVLGFLDDGRTPGTLASPHAYAVLGGVDLLAGLDVAFVPAIGDTGVRRRIVEEYPDHEAATLVHPSATLGSHVEHGPGLVMAAGARLTHGISLGQHVHVNVNASISHDCRVGDFVTITPGVHVSGNVTLEEGVWVGIGACVIQGVTVGANAFVGAGAAVVDDLPANMTAVGVPARPMAPTTGVRR